MLSLVVATLVGFIKFATASENRGHHFFLAVAHFPFWAVLVISALSYLASSVRASYAYRVARTLHLNHQYTFPDTAGRRPSRPRVSTNPAEVTERDITSATPTSANYFRNV